MTIFKDSTSFTPALLAANNISNLGGVLPSKRLLGMCRWMASHVHIWVDYNGVTFLVELLEWGCTFSGFLEILVNRVFKIGICCCFNIALNSVLEITITFIQK